MQYYRDADDESFVPGLMHVNLGGYHIRDIEFSAAFDIDSRKVGLDLSEAIAMDPNNTIKLADVPTLGVKVHRGMTHDGLGRYGAQKITKAAGPTDDVVGILKDSGTDVVVSYLPVGSELATKWYVEQVLNAGCGFVNCVPQFIAREAYLSEAIATEPNNTIKLADVPPLGVKVRGRSASKAPTRPAGYRRRHQESGWRDHSSIAPSPACSASGACGWNAPRS